MLPAASGAGAAPADVPWVIEAASPLVEVADLDTERRGAAAREGADAGAGACSAFSGVGGSGRADRDFESVGRASCRREANPAKPCPSSVTWMTGAPP